MPSMHGLWVIFLMAIFASAAPGQERFLAPRERGKADPDLPFIVIVQVDKAPTIDGKLDDACWRRAKESSVFADEYGFPVKTRTTFKICQKDDVLYLGMRAGYEPGKLPKEPPSNTKLHDGDFWQGKDRSRCA